MTDFDVLLYFVVKAATAVRANIPQASGKTANSIQTEVLQGDGYLKAFIYAPSWITVLETGRRPYNPPGDKVAGDKPLTEATFVGAIQAWINSRGLQDKLNAWAVAKSIQRKGTVLYRQGGNSGVISKAINEQTTSELKAALSAFYIAKFKSEIFISK